jgi:hypothetical protein
MILLNEATTSRAVTGSPSQKRAFLCNLKVYFLPPSVGPGTSTAKSPTKSVGEEGFSGMAVEAGRIGCHYEDQGAAAFGRLRC